MLDVAHELAIERGFRGLRIEDVIRAAGVSRGSFYAYFEDNEDYVQIVGALAIQDMAVTVDDLPKSTTARALRRWLARHAEVNRRSGALVRIWIEAAEGPTRGDRAAVIDRSRSRVAALLRTRPLGDVEVEAVILLAFVEIFGSRNRTRAELDAEVAAVERAFLAP
jgi:AcrR family transcriptional regulator